MIGGGIGGALTGPLGAVLGATLGKPLLEIGQRIDERLGRPIAGLYDKVSTFTKTFWAWMPRSWDQAIDKFKEIGKWIWEYKLTSFHNKTIGTVLTELYTKVVGKVKDAGNAIHSKAIWGGAITGALGGALAGLKVGSLVGGGVGAAAGGVGAAPGALIGGAVGAVGGALQGGIAGGVGGHLATKHLVSKDESKGDPPPDTLFAEKNIGGYRDSVAISRAGTGGERLPLNVAALSEDIALGQGPADPRKQGWSGKGGWLSKAKMQREENKTNDHRLERRAQTAGSAMPSAASAMFDDGESLASAWRGFRTFTRDGKKAYLKNEKYETVDDWDPNDGTQTEGGWLSKLFGGMFGAAGNVWGGIGDLFGAKGKIVGGGTIDWNGKGDRLEPGLVKRINLLAQQSGEHLVVTDGYRSEARINEMAEEYTRKYGRPYVDDKLHWKWRVPGQQDQVLNKFGTGYDTHAQGRAVDISIPGKPWGSNELRNVNRLAKSLGLHGYKDTETKGHFNIPTDGSLDKGDAPPLTPVHAPTPPPVTADNIASGGNKGAGGNTYVGGATYNMMSAPQVSGGSGGSAYPTEMWALLNAMSAAPAGGFA
jgi:hypothetical protein